MTWSGPAKIKTYEEDDTWVSSLLYNFDVGSAWLKAQHRSWLEKLVAQFDGQSLKVGFWGYASRSGALEWNQQLAYQRVRAVGWYLHYKGVPYEKFTLVASSVEPTGGDPNDEEWRSVHLIATTLAYDFSPGLSGE